jgi:hypothetical protein
VTPSEHLALALVLPDPEALPIISWLRCAVCRKQVGRVCRSSLGRLINIPIGVPTASGRDWRAFIDLLDEASLEPSYVAWCPKHHELELETGRLAAAWPKPTGGPSDILLPQAQRI